MKTVKYKKQQWYNPLMSVLDCSMDSAKNGCNNDVFKNNSDLLKG